MLLAACVCADFYETLPKDPKTGSLKLLLSATSHLGPFRLAVVVAGVVVFAITGCHSSHIDGVVLGLGDGVVPAGPGAAAPRSDAFIAVVTTSTGACSSIVGESIGNIGILPKSNDVVRARRRRRRRAVLDPAQARHLRHAGLEGLAAADGARGGGRAGGMSVRVRRRQHVIGRLGSFSCCWHWCWKMAPVVPSAPNRGVGASCCRGYRDVGWSIVGKEQRQGAGGFEGWVDTPPPGNAGIECIAIRTYLVRSKVAS